MERCCAISPPLQQCLRVFRSIVIYQASAEIGGQKTTVLKERLEVLSLLSELEIVRGLQLPCGLGNAPDMSLPNPRRELNNYKQDDLAMNETRRERCAATDRVTL
jgi:hypothetical protein